MLMLRVVGLSSFASLPNLHIEPTGRYVGAEGERSLAGRSSAGR
jgi:hypothetical protein